MKSQSKTLRLIALATFVSGMSLVSGLASAQSIEVGVPIGQTQYYPSAQVVVSGPNYQVTYGRPTPVVNQVVYQTVSPVVPAPVRVYDHRYDQRRQHEYRAHSRPVYYAAPVQYVAAPRYAPAPHYVPVAYVAPAPVLVKPAPIYHQRTHTNHHNGW